MADEQPAGADGKQPDADPNGTDLVPDRPLDPEKLLRMAGVVKAVLDEVRQFDPDEATAAELSSMHQRVQAQIDEALPNVLRDELAEVSFSVAPGRQASGQDLRVAYAGLIGWLGGMFQGLQAAIQAQQIRGMQALGAGEDAAANPQADSREPHAGLYL